LQDIWELGYCQHFPDRKDDVAVMWRDALLTLCDAAAWDFQRTSVCANTARCTTFVMPPQDELRRRFVQNCGNIDARIWTAEWTIE